MGMNRKAATPYRTALDAEKKARAEYDACRPFTVVRGVVVYQREKKQALFRVWLAAKCAADRLKGGA